MHIRSASRVIFVLAALVLAQASVPARADTWPTYSSCDTWSGVPVGASCVSTRIASIDIACRDASPFIACDVAAQIAVRGWGSVASARGIAKSRVYLDVFCGGYAACGSTSSEGTCAWRYPEEGCTFTMTPSLTIAELPNHYSAGGHCMFVVARLRFVSEAGLDSSVALLMPASVRDDPRLPPNVEAHPCIPIST